MSNAQLGVIAGGCTLSLALVIGLMMIERSDPPPAPPMSFRVHWYWYSQTPGDLLCTATAGRSIVLSWHSPAECRDRGRREAIAYLKRALAGVGTAMFITPRNKSSVQKRTLSPSWDWASAR